MYIGLKHLHSYWAYLVVVLVLIALVNALIGLMGNKKFTPKDRRLTLFALIAVHVQFLVGIILYFVSPLSGGALADMGTAMKDPVSRLYGLEHPLVMLIAVVLITVGNARAKRIADDQGKFRNLTVLFGAAFLLILSRIPWAAWLG